MFGSIEHNYWVDHMKVNPKNISLRNLTEAVIGTGIIKGTGSRTGTETSRCTWTGIGKVAVGTWTGHAIGILTITLTGSVAGKNSNRNSIR